MYSNPPMDYAYHTPSSHQWSIPPTYSTPTPTPSFPSFPWELFTPYYTHGSSSPKFYLNHGYSPHTPTSYPPPPNPYSYYSSSPYSYDYNNYHQLQPTKISYKIKKEFEKHLQVSHLSFKKYSQKNSKIILPKSNSTNIRLKTIRSGSYYASPSSNFSTLDVSSSRKLPSLSSNPLSSSKFEKENKTPNSTLPFQKGNSHTGGIKDLTQLNNSKQQCVEGESRGKAITEEPWVVSKGSVAETTKVDVLEREGVIRHNGLAFDVDNVHVTDTVVEDLTIASRDGGSVQERVFVDWKYKFSAVCKWTVKMSSALSSSSLVSSSVVAGPVSDVFNESKLNQLPESLAIGHVHYSTARQSMLKNVQPFVTGYRFGSVGVAHNGNLVNYRTLRAKLEEKGSIFNTTSDIEIALHLIFTSKHKPFILRIVDACEKLEGAYSIVFVTEDKLIAMSDPFGFRPLVMGRRSNGVVVFGSEICALDLIEATYVREVFPGEVVVVDDNGVKQIMNSTENLLLQTQDAAVKLNTRIHMHVAEIPYENELVVDVHKVNHITVTYLDKINFLQNNLLTAHSVWVDDNETSLLSRAGVKVSHCPAAAMRMLGAGICVSLGTNEAPSNNRMSIVDEMYLASLINKRGGVFTHRTTDPTALSAETILKMVTVNGAKSVQWDDELGSLEVGKKADIVVVNPSTWSMVPIHDCISNMVYCMRTENAVSVMYNGLCIRKDKNIVTVDEGEVILKAKQTSAELLAIQHLHVTFLNTEYIHNRLIHFNDDIQALSECYPMLQFKNIPDFLSEEKHTGFGEKIRDEIESLSLYGKPFLQDIIVFEKITFIILDGIFGEHDIDLVAEFGIQLIHFLTISACCFWSLHQFIHFRTVSFGSFTPMKKEEIIENLGYDLLESVGCGVPVICWAYFADQQVNSRFVREVWKLGLDMKDVCDRNMVESMVNKVMMNMTD